MKAIKGGPVLAGTGFVMCLVFSGLQLFAADPSGLPRRTGERLRGFNNEILRLHGEMQQSTSDLGIAEVRRQAKTVIEQRASEMAALMEQDPAQAVSMAFSQEVLTDLAAKFPEAQGRLEIQGTWQGSAHRWFEDYPDGSSKTGVKMKIDGEDLDLRFAGVEPSSFKCDDVLQVTGVRLGTRMAVATSNVAASSVTTSGTCSTTGVQNTAVLLVTFTGAAAPPATITPQSVFNMFFANPGPSVDAYWREASYGQTSATGNVFGWYTLDPSYASCGALGALRDAAVAAASNTGVNFQNYQRIFVVTTDFGCGWAGWALGGCMTLSSPSGSYFASTAVLDATWLGGQTQGAQTAAHEGGHNLGLGHAQLRNFGPEALGPLAAAGTITEYGDVFSDMAVSNIGHYAAQHKIEQLNWISSANYQIVQNSGTWTLQPFENSPTGLMALKIQRGTGNNAWLWVEYRQAIGFDSNVWPSAGAVIHYEDSSTGLHTQLLDFTPATATNAYDSPLMPGSTWVDPYTNLSITVQSATSSGLTVTVNYGATPCTPTPATVTVSPVNPSLYAGQSVSYSVSVTNNDTAGCSSSTFNLGSTQPSGWSSTFSTPSLTLSPGQSGSVTVGKGAPSGTAAGIYGVNVSASTTSSNGAGTANATVMTAPALTANLTVSGTSFTSGQTAGFTTTALNNGIPAGGASVTYTLTKSDNSQVSKTVTANSSGTATWSDKIGPKDPRGTWSIAAKVTSGSLVVTSSPVSFKVQ